jgi:hypothetical protein
MTSPRSLRLAGVLTTGLLAAACQSFEVEPVQVALISVPTEQTEAGYETSPSAFFIEGTGIGLSSTAVGQEGCIDRLLSLPGGVPNFEYIDAGTSITAHFDGPDVTLTKTSVDGRPTYTVPEGLELEFTPGEVITFTIPGAAGGFPARTVSARTAEVFTASPITLPTTTSDDLTVTWTPVPEATGSAMFYSIRYSSTGATQDREIACVFRDDGSGVIGANVLSAFRSSSNRSAFAQRGRITASRTGNAITHVTSTFQIPVVLTDAT